MATILQPRAHWKEQPSWPRISAQQRWYSWGNCRVSVGKDPDGNWHLSISCPNRNPTWEEIKQARYDLCPHEITMAMILPPTDEYVNLHEHCFHLHQIPNE